MSARFWERLSGRSIALSLLFGIAAADTAAAQGRVSVTQESPRRTCPAMTCGTIGFFYKGESLFPYERVTGWTRVSPYSSAACQQGKTPFVKSGPAECTVENGIRGGEFAEWIRSDHLMTETF